MSDLQLKYTAARNLRSAAGYVPGPESDACQAAEWALHQAEGRRGIELVHAWLLETA